MRATLRADRLQCLRIYARIFGAEAVAKNRATFLDTRPHANAASATRTARQTRAEIEALRALTPAEAVQRIEQTHAAQEVAREAAEHALAEHRWQLAARSPSRDGGLDHEEAGLSR